MKKKIARTMAFLLALGVLTNISYFDFERGVISPDIRNAVSEAASKEEGDGYIRAKNSDSVSTSYMLTASGDSTDRAEEIEALLNSNGYCFLGPGDFYITGIVMPDTTELYGCGAKTRIVLLDSVTDGAAIKMKSYCSIHDLMVGTDDNYVPSETANGRIGIVRENDDRRHYIFGKIYNVSIVGISQGIVATDITTGDRTGLSVTNVSIYKCDIGLKIKKCEYCRFDNMIISECYYGVLNNSGNNLFSNCTFNSCTEGFGMDDSTVTNTGHGSCMGCQFNHMGYAVRANDMDDGFVFSGCQFFSGKISITNSYSIGIHGCNFGSTNGQTGYLVEVENNDGMDRVMLIDNCIFSKGLMLSKTDISGTTKVIVSNCYTKDGMKVTAEGD